MFIISFFAQIIVNVCAKRVMEKKKKMKNMSSGSLTLHVLTSAFQNFDLSPATKSQLLVRTAQIFTAPRGRILQDFVMCWRMNYDSYTFHVLNMAKIIPATQYHCYFDHTNMAADS